MDTMSGIEAKVHHKEDNKIFFSYDYKGEMYMIEAPVTRNNSFLDTGDQITIYLGMNKD